MNELNLPPHRELPDDVRDRIRTAVHAESPPARTVRWRAPLAVAAGVAALVAAAIVVVRPVDDLQAGTQPPVPIRSGDLTLTQPDAQTDRDLDRCAAMIAEDPQAPKYSPRAMWVPVFTVHRDVPGYGQLKVPDENTGAPAGHTGAPAEPRVIKVEEARIVAFRQAGDKPVFCEIYQDYVVLSDPAPDYPLITLAKNDDADIHVEFTSFSTNIMLGVAQGVTALDCRIVPSRADRENLGRQVSTPPALVQDGLFAMQTDNLVAQDWVDVVGFDNARNVVVSGGRAFDQSVVWPAGVVTGQG